jgi:hypothetical protein
LRDSKDGPGVCRWRRREELEWARQETHSIVLVQALEGNLVGPSDAAQQHGGQEGGESELHLDKGLVISGTFSVVVSEADRRMA